MEIAQLKRIIEAAIMAANTPQTLLQLNDLFGEENPPGVDSIHAAIELLQSDYAERGVGLVEVASGWRFQVHADMQPWVSRLWTERQSKYTRALLETLALIAYRQPVTRAEIEQIRGVAVSSNIIKTLEEREWIRVLGHRDVPGRPALFGTTRQFLDYFALKSLDQLPPLAELRDLSEIEPQLEFDGITPIRLADTSPEIDIDEHSSDVDSDTLTINATATNVSTADDVFLSDDDAIDAFVETDDISDIENNVESITEQPDPFHESIEANAEDGESSPASAKDMP